MLIEMGCIPNLLTIKSSNNKWWFVEGYIYATRHTNQLILVAMLLGRNIAGSVTSWDELWCPCCGYRLRTKPRHSKYKAKLREQKNRANQ